MKDIHENESISEQSEEVVAENTTADIDEDQGITDNEPDQESEKESSQEVPDSDSNQETQSTPERREKISEVSFWDSGNAGNFGFAGTDSTSVIDIVSTVVETDDALTEEATTWLSQAISSLKERNEAIQHGIDLTKTLAADLNFNINMAGKTIAQKTIIIGKSCNRLKYLNQGSKTPWGPFAEENLKFISKRNRQKYMSVASREDCHELDFLGIDCLDALCSLTKGLKKEFPDQNVIKILFAEYDIPYDDRTEMDMEDFRKKIDRAIKHQRLKRKGLEIPFELLNEAMDNGIKIDNSLVKRLKDAEASGGDRETLLKNIIAKNDEDDPEREKEQRMDDFNTLSAKLSQTVEYLLDDIDELEKLDRDLFDCLWEKLKELKEIFEPAETAAA